ncbi:AAA family ATPase [Acinetobacter johnsonii]|uniref:AAA family ATPase n=1 Tax=Acinetobacter johnsonii TaxID=40214 RepID=UPI00191FB1CC|nr:AAA family ATPase [Acinetobacter johnsonii]QQV10683.1 AAA family ATPase [Acinetobacter johnsonii]
MKIKSIAKIDNFGIFQNFDWNTHLSSNLAQQNQTYDFKDINIFYGRNYSGKTSLSKIIRALETKTLSPKYENPNFSIELSDSSIISQNNLSAFAHPIHVYNSDFIRENLKFIHDENANIESFSVTLGGENQQVLDRIQQLKNELGSNEEICKSALYLDIHNKANEVQNAKTNHQNKVRDLDKKLSDKATRNSDSIKNQHERFGNIRYDKRSLEADISEVLHNNYQQLNLTQIELFENTVRQRKLSAPPELSPYTLNFSSLITSTNDILKSVVGSSDKIDELKNNPSLNSWAQIGHPLHNDRTTCAFCNNEISDQRRKELANHFDEETDKLRDRISKGIKYLDKLLSNSPLNISFDMTNYYQQYHPELSQLQTNLQNAFAKQKSSIELLKKSLEDKDKKLFSELSIEHPQDHSTEIKTILERISQIRTECIQKNDQLYSLQNEAKNALRLDHIYLFLQSINYTQLTSDIDLAFEAIAPLEIELATLQTRKTTITTEIKSEEDKLKSEGEACRRIKNILNHDFGHQALSLEPIEANTTNGKEIKFEIQRNGTKAHNLSEGEQSLISFCYFLAKIQDDLDQNKKPIIWIDDPISSLDSNHIFFIFSLIEEKIVINQKFGQLFISTHNLEFLKYLKRLNGKKWGNIQFFIVKRNFDSSAIFQMPIYMKNYFSELNFLFHQLYLCASEENINDQNYNIFYNFPNNARKFLELYSNFHYPDGFSNTDTEKLQFLWGEHLVFTFTDRINNEYSHLAGIFERSFTPLEQP